MHVFEKIMPRVRRGCIAQGTKNYEKVSYMKKYRNIIFDVGWVLADFRYRAYMKDLGFTPEEVELFVDNVVMTDFWKDLDRGVRDHAEAPAYFKERMPEYADKIDLFWEHIEDIAWPYDYSEGLLKSIKDAGYNIYILSNYPKRLSDIHWKKFTFNQYSDGTVISGYELMVKPEPEFYELLFKRYDIDPADSIFIDDRQDNVEGAEAFGVTGIVFTGLDDLLVTFREMGIDIDYEK
jgi:putative hydrolase of the HAD superfamily